MVPQLVGRVACPRALVPCSHAGVLLELLAALPPGAAHALEARGATRVLPCILICSKLLRSSHNCTHPSHQTTRPVGGWVGKYDHLAVISAARQNPAASSRQACPPFSSNVGRAKGYHGTVILSPRADNAFGVFGNAAMSSTKPSYKLQVLKRCLKILLTTSNPPCRFRPHLRSGGDLFGPLI